ncbi:MAG: ATPase, T2SS/T4P/T4SS family [Fervidicoccaceae archaeon]
MSLSFLRIRRKKLSLEEIVAEIAQRAESELSFGDRPGYLVEYMEKAEKEHGMKPEFHERLSGELKKLRSYSIIYPVGGGIFIHVHNLTSEGGYGRYIVIEPPHPNPKLMKAIDELLAIKISGEIAPRSSEEKKAILLYLLDEILESSENDPSESAFRRSVKRGKLQVKRSDIPLIKYHVIREKVGTGILEPFLRDPYLEDVSLSGVGNIFVVHKIFGSMESNAGFTSDEELDNFIIKLGEKIGKPISAARPIIDSTLPDGSRINIVFSTEVSLRGSNFTIRRVAKYPISVTQLIDWGTMDSRIAAYIWMMLREGMSAFICGETASGKTTTLNAISTFIKPNAKIVSIEDTSEVVFPHSNWTRELTRDTGRPESSVTMFDLLRAALRQRPNYIIVGEIRGAEGNIAFQAMQSVSWETPVLIKLGNKPPKLTAIGALVDRYFQSFSEEGSRKAYDLRTLSLSRRGRALLSPVSYVLRHKAREIYEIEVENGGKVEATGSHSIFILDMSSLLIKPAQVSSIRPGEKMVMLRVGTSAHLLKKTGWDTIEEEPFFEVSEEVDDSVALSWSEKMKIHRERSISIELVEKALKRSGISALELLRLSGYRPREQKKLTERELRLLMKLMGDLREKVRNEGQFIISRLLDFISSDIEIVEIKSIRKKSYDGYVYDLSVPVMELFLGGTSPLALHNTGHPVMSTFHAADITKLIQRLTNPPISIPKTNMDSLNIAWFQSAVYVKGFPARRVTYIYEIMGYDPASDAVAAMPVFTWDPVEDRFIFSGRGASYLLEEKIARAKAIPKSRIKEIYDELELRRRFIDELVRRKIFEYDRVFKAVTTADQIGVERALKELEEGRLAL